MKENQGNAASSQVGQKADLTRRDWVLGALSALVDGGVDAVRIEPLAERLGVTKGSFYWHFKDRKDLLDAVLTFWEEEFTTRLVERTSEPPTPQARLRLLAQEALAETIQGLDNARSEMAMLAWAAKDADVALRLARIDAVRLNHLIQELGTLGFSPERAEVLAKALYQAIFGLYATRAYNPETASNDAFLTTLELVLAETRWNR